MITITNGNHSGNANANESYVYKGKLNNVIYLYDILRIIYLMDMEHCIEEMVQYISDSLLMEELKDVDSMV